MAPADALPVYVIDEASETQTELEAENVEVGSGNTVTCAVSFDEHPLLVAVTI